MLALTRVLTLEKPKIQKALEKVVDSLPPSVREVAAYALLQGGKRLRPLLLVSMARLCGAKEEGLYQLSTAVEMIHVATLLHDDVLDHAQSRRGQKAAHLKFGTSACLLAGDALLAQACEIVTSCRNLDMMTCITKAIVQTTAGECREIALQGSLSHSMDEYREIIEGKTGWLIRASSELGALYAQASPQTVEAAALYGLHVGIAFQIVDDALDFAPESATGKPCGGDVREGKYTPPIHWYYQGLSPQDQAIFAQKFSTCTFDDAEVDAIAASIRQQGLDNKTRNLAATELSLAAQALADLPKGSQKAIFEYVMEYVRQRGQ